MRFLLISIKACCVGSSWLESRLKVVRVTFALYSANLLGTRGGCWRTRAVICTSLEAHIDSQYIFFFEIRYES